MRRYCGGGEPFCSETQLVGIYLFRNKEQKCCRKQVPMVKVHIVQQCAPKHWGMNVSCWGKEMKWPAVVDWWASALSESHSESCKCHCVIAFPWSCQTPTAAACRSVPLGISNLVLLDGAFGLKCGPVLGGYFPPQGGTSRNKC